MARPVLLFSGPFADLPLEELARLSAEWGYAGLELAAWGDHFSVSRASTDPDYAGERLALLATHDLQVPALAAFRASTAVGDRIDERHQALLPEHVWGDGDPRGVNARAADEMIETVRAAQRIGAAVVVGFTGSPVWSYVCGYPGPTTDAIDRAFAEVVRRWQPILDECADAGVRFACEVHPGQLAFDFYSAERLLDAFDRRPEFGFCVDPAHFHWQGMDPAAFVRAFGERIFHVHMKDAVVKLDGRAGLLGSYLPYGDHRRGWDFRSPGRGGVDWEAFIRALNEAGFDGPLSVDWRDEGLDRAFGAEEACRFVRQLDFPTGRPLDSRVAFR